MAHREEEGFCLSNFFQFGCFLSQTGGLLVFMRGAENYHTSRRRWTADVLQTHLKNISVQSYFFFPSFLQKYASCPQRNSCVGFLVFSCHGWNASLPAELWSARSVCLSANDRPEALKTYWNNNHKDSKVTSVWWRFASSSSPLPLWGLLGPLNRIERGRMGLLNGSRCCAVWCTLCSTSCEMHLSIKCFSRWDVETSDFHARYTFFIQVNRRCVSQQVCLCQWQ